MHTPHTLCLIRYVSELIPARYEYDQAWNPKWKPKADALSVALRAVPTVPHPPPQMAGTPVAPEAAAGALGADGGIAVVELAAAPVTLLPPEPEEVGVGLRDGWGSKNETCEPGYGSTCWSGMGGGMCEV